MAARWYESFDTETAKANWGLRYEATSIGVNFNFVGGRTGNAANMPASTVTKILDSQATWTIGFAFRPQNWTGGEGEVLEIIDNATVQVMLKYTGGGTGVFKLYNGSTTLLATGTIAMTGTGTFHYIELTVTINNITGSYTLKVDGATDFSATNQNTRNSANNTADRLKYGDINSSASSAVYFDDLYINDGTGGSHNSFEGAVKIECLRPNGAGTTTQWTPDTGSNYTRVNETAEDGDTSYVADSTVGHIDTYAYGDLATTVGTIIGVQPGYIARKDDLSIRQIGAEYRSGGTNYDGASTFSLTGSYAFYSEIKNTDPATGVGWTISGVNALEVGQKVLA